MLQYCGKRWPAVWKHPDVKALCELDQLLPRPGRHRTSLPSAPLPSRMRSGSRQYPQYRPSARYPVHPAINQFVTAIRERFRIGVNLLASNAAIRAARTGEAGRKIRKMMRR